MKFFVRMMSLLLAVILTMGMIMVAFPFGSTAYAAGKLSLGEGHVGVKVSGIPQESFFDDDIGAYEVTVKTISTAASTADIKKPKGNTTTGLAITSINSGKTLLIGGVSCEKPDGGTWVAEDKFTIAVVEGASGSERDPAISFQKVTTFSSTEGVNGDRSRTNVTRITRGTRVNLLLTVEDTSYDFVEYVEGTAKPYATIHAGDFTNSYETKHDIKAIEGVGGKLAFEIGLYDLMYGGSGNNVKFSYGYNIGGKPVERTLNVKIPYTKEYTDKTSSEEVDNEKELDPLLPHIIVSNYNYGTAQVVAGQFIEMDLQFTNTSDRYDLHNIKMTIETGEAFTITSGSNTYYIPDLNIGANIQQKISMQANPTAKPQSHSLNIKYEFQYVANDKRISGTSAESISIPISQPDRFQVNDIQTPNSLMVGEEYPLSLSFVNKGKAEVFNVSAELKGNITNSGERTFIGNVLSGGENSADFYITGLEEGILEGEILITYEDSNMNLKEISKPFQIKVEAFDFGPPGGGIDEGVINPEPVEPEGMSVKDMMLYGVAFAVAALTACLTILKIKAKRSDFANEDL